jgi:lipid II:glycine glycyltransferase (peptidoglycan interpeptide bridge formation enzyme)
LALLSETEWEEVLKGYPQAHIMQLAGWGKLKSHFGWKPFRVANDKAGAQILFRKLPFNFSIAYIPKGPLGRLTSFAISNMPSSFKSSRMLLNLPLTYRKPPGLKASKLKPIPSNLAAPV